MSRQTCGSRGEARGSALWGSGNRGGEHRSNALWGKGGRGSALILALGVVLSLAAGAGTPKQAEAAGASHPTTYVEPGLLERADAGPNEMFRVILQSNVAAQTAEQSFEQVEDDDDRALQWEANAAARAEQKANVLASKSRSKGERERAYQAKLHWKALRGTLGDLRRKLRGDLDDRFEFIKGVAVEISGRRLKLLARVPGLTITEDVQVVLTDGGLPLGNGQMWPAASGLVPLLATMGRYPAAPAIAIVDSGIEANRADFGGGSRVVEHEVFTTLQPNAAGDGRGHGTFVASIAAGSAPGRLGASPTSPIVDVDVMNDQGVARTSDVIAGAEWIYQNRKALNIRVANFSLHAARPSNFTKDPLNRAVEKLWFGGVVVVAAAGNYGSPSGPSGVRFAPGNDPFVITVGALDLGNSLRASRHEVPSWSAYGRTYDGFLKPEVSAAGRYMLGAVPAGSTLAATKAENIVAPGYMRLSGTSFAAPVVAGAAAQLLARHPEWTPDQVKGAIMATARGLSRDRVPTGAGGVGELNAWRAAMLHRPPNPNLGLNRFLVTDPATGTVSFDAVSWADVARADVSWDAVSWADVSWADVSWADVSWADVSWADVSWADVSWADVLAVADLSFEDGADDATSPPVSDTVPEAELEAGLAAEPELFPAPEPVATAAAPAEAEPVVDAVDLVVEAATTVEVPDVPTVVAP